MTLYTIGHSNQPFARFLSMLQANGVVRLVDIRSAPHSRFNPQFSQPALKNALNGYGIEYAHLKALGGLHHRANDAAPWRNYAEYMETPPFKSALDALIALGGDGPIAIMCAEAKPENCNRFHVSDALLARGIPVLHILSPDRAEPHPLPSTPAQKALPF